MADTKQDKHEKALDLTEAALEALDTGDEAKADQLIARAKKLDPSAVEEVVEDLAEAEQADAQEFRADEGDEADTDGLDDDEADEDEGAEDAEDKRPG